MSDTASTQTTRAEYHADADAPTVRTARQTIRRLLEAHAGRDNAIASSALADRVGLKPTTVRDIVSELRDEGVVPIGSCAQGYYRIDSPAEFRDVMASIEDEIQTKRDRQSAIAAAFYGGDGGE